MNQASPIIFDHLLAGTELRGLIVRGPMCLCAYLGVPKDHWLADMDDLNFQCHWSVNFSDMGDGVVRPAGWWWYGWDYGHAGDQIDLPDIEFVNPEITSFYARFARQGKRWTLEDVEHDLIDSAVSLDEILRKTNDQMTQSFAGLKQS